MTLQTLYKYWLSKKIRTAFKVLVSKLRSVECGLQSANYKYKCDCETSSYYLALLDVYLLLTKLVRTSRFLYFLQQRLFMKIIPCHTLIFTNTSLISYFLISRYDVFFSPKKLFNQIIEYCKFKVFAENSKKLISVRHVTGWDEDYLRKIPRVVW